MKKMVIYIMKISSVLLIVLILIGILFSQSCSSATYTSKDIKMEKIEKSKQYNNEKFLNYKPSPDWGFAKMLPVMWDFLFSDNDRKPEEELPRQPIDFEKINNTKPDELKITWVGHSSQIINIDGKIILTDPVYDNRTAFMGPSRYNGDVPLRIEELPEIDLVVISHNHYDHLNSSTIEKIHPNVKQFPTIFL